MDYASCDANPPYDPFLQKPESHGPHDGVHDAPAAPLSETEFKMLGIISNQTSSMQQLLDAFGYKTRNRNIRTSINNLLKNNLIALTIPDKVKSKKQRYKITAQGQTVFEQHSKILLPSNNDKE